MSARSFLFEPAYDHTVTSPCSHICKFLPPIAPLSFSWFDFPAVTSAVRRVWTGRGCRFARLFKLFTLTGASCSPLERHFAEAKACLLLSFSPLPACGYPKHIFESAGDSFWEVCHQATASDAFSFSRVSGLLVIFSPFYHGLLTT